MRQITESGSVIIGEVASVEQEGEASDPSLKILS